MAVCVIAGSAAAAGAATGSGSPGWVATHTQALHVDAPVLGALPAAQRLHVSLTLPLRNTAAMQQRIHDVTTPGTAAYQHVMSPAQVLAEFGPTSSQVGAVENYLRQQGFRDISAASNRLLVDATGTAAQVQRAFHTSLLSYALDGRTVYANAAPASVPANLAGAVTAVLGLSNLPMTAPLTRAASSHPATPAGVAASGSPDLSGFTPRAVAHAYDADRLPPATGTSVAVVMGGDPAPIIKNLRTAEKAWHFPQVPVSVRYGATPQVDANDNPMTGNTEWDLDTQISTMVAGAVNRLWMYDVSTFTDPEVARAINLFVADDHATALSASLGECDAIAFLDGAMITTDEALAEGALQGQSMFASTGDNGYACPLIISTGLPGGPPGVSWPSTGEYVTAVGGTTLIADDQGNVTQEVAWIAGGGGISPWETAPPWTLRANPAGQSWQYTNQGGRGVPDVAALADANTPYLVYDGSSGQPVGVGGTSVSSPLVMGLWARIQSARGNRLGLASADFYRLYNKVNPGTVVQQVVTVYTPQPNPGPVTGFRDITLGSNGVYPATPGYDYTTGIGVLDALQLVHAL